MYFKNRESSLMDKTFRVGRSEMRRRQWCPCRVAVRIYPHSTRRVRHSPCKPSPPDTRPIFCAFPQCNARLSEGSYGISNEEELTMPARLSDVWGTMSKPLTEGKRELSTTNGRQTLRISAWRPYREAWRPLVRQASSSPPITAMMDAFHTFERPLGLAAVLLFAYLVLLQIRERMMWRHRTRGRPLPPGPRPLPFIGNLLDMPQLRQWVGFRDLCSEHGMCMVYKSDLAT